MLPLSSVRGIKKKKSRRGRDLENFTTTPRDPSLHLKICYAVISHVIWELLSSRVEDSSRNSVTKISTDFLYPLYAFYIFFRFFKSVLQKEDSPCAFCGRYRGDNERSKLWKVHVLARILWIHSGKRMSVRVSSSMTDFSVDITRRHSRDLSVSLNGLKVGYRASFHRSISAAIRLANMS